MSSYWWTKTAAAEFRRAKAGRESEAGADAAEAFEENVRRLCEQIAAFPLSGSLQPALGRRVRSRVVDHHVIYFRPVRDGVQIARFLHERRDRSLAFKRRRPVKPRKRTRKPA